MESKTTHELAHGDIVITHGMRIRLDEANRETYESRGSVVVSWPGEILNTDEVLNWGVVPPSWISDGTWRIQGNDLATWAVEGGRS